MRTTNRVYLLVVLFIATSIWAYQARALGWTDSQIVKTLITINEGEIDAAQIASKNAQNAEVKNFAALMVTEHEANAKETKRLTDQRDLTSQDSTLSASIKSEAKLLNKELKKSDKAQFDRAYVAQQVLMHQKALITLDETLIPNAQDPEFKNHLLKTRQAVMTHLNHAKNLQEKLL